MDISGIPRFTICKMDIRTPMNELIDKAKDLHINIYTPEGNIKKKPQLLAEIHHHSTINAVDKVRKDSVDKVEYIRTISDLAEAKKYQESSGISDDAIRTLIYNDTVAHIALLSPIEQLFKLHTLSFTLVLVDDQYGFKQDIVGTKDDIIDRLVAIDMTYFDGKPDIVNTLIGEKYNYTKLQSEITKFHTDQWSYIGKADYGSILSFCYSMVVGESDIGYLIIRR